MSDFPYDATYDPAAPVCTLSMSVRSSGRRVEFNAIIDTGADGTITPIHYLREIGARRAFEVGMRSQWGERRQVFLYLVDMQIGGAALPGVYVVGDESGQESVVGRNVLNQLKVLLDGPSALTQLLK